MRTCLAGLAVLTAAGIAGCGSGSHAKTAIAASPPTAHSVCKEGFRELETIDRHKLVPEPSVFGRLIAEAARESEQVDAHTEVRLKRMRPLSDRGSPRIPPAVSVSGSGGLLLRCDPSSGGSSAASAMRARCP